MRGKCGIVNFLVFSGLPLRKVVFSSFCDKQNALTCHVTPPLSFARAVLLLSSVGPPRMQNNGTFAVFNRRGQTLWSSTTS